MVSAVTKKLDHHLLTCHLASKLANEMHSWSPELDRISLTHFRFLIVNA